MAEPKPTLNHVADATDNVVQSLVLHALTYAQKRGCVKDTTHVFLPVVDCLKRFTHSYKEWLTFNDLVFSSVTETKDAKFDLWLALTSSASIAYRVSHIIQNAEYPDLLPQYRPQQRYFSFQNGLLDTETAHFYSRDDPNVPVPVGVTAHVFMDQAFDPTPRELWRAEVRNVLHPVLVVDVIGLVGGYAQEETVMERLWRAHGFTSDEAIAWCWAWLARGCLFPNRHRDHWQRTLMVTGPEDIRMLMYHIIRSLFNPNHLGVISPYFESSFVLSHIYDKFTYLAPGVDEEWTAVSEHILKKMNRKKPITVPRKHDYPKELLDGMPCSGIWFGTAIPKHITDCGSGSELVVMALSSSTAIDIDPEVDYAKTKAELPRYIREMMLNYHRLSAAFPGDRDDGLDWFDFHLPPSVLAEGPRPVVYKQLRRSISPSKQLLLVQ